MKRIGLCSIMLMGLTTTWAVPAHARPADELAGTWHGTFWQVNAGDTGYVHGDVELRINDDGSYQETFMTWQVAGSSRTARHECSGAVAVNSTGTQVTLTDWRKTRLQDNGEVLRGVMIDQGSGRTIALQLRKEGQPGQ